MYHHPASATEGALFWSGVVPLLLYAWCAQECTQPKHSIKVENGLELSRRVQNYRRKMCDEWRSNLVLPCGKHVCVVNSATHV